MISVKLLVVIMVNHIAGRALTGRLWESHGNKSRIEYDIVNDYASIDVNLATKQCIGLSS